MGEIWRFDKTRKRGLPDSGPLSKILGRLKGTPYHNFQDGYELRQPEVPNKRARFGPGPRQFVYDADHHEKLDKVRIIASTVLDSTLRADLSELLLPEVLDEFECGASTGRSTDYLNNLDTKTQFSMRTFMNRVFIASTLYDMSW
jgi:hypothetical protein